MNEQQINATSEETDDWLKKVHATMQRMNSQIIAAFRLPPQFLGLQVEVAKGLDEYQNLCRHIGLEESAAERILKEEANAHGLKDGIKLAKIRVIREALS